MLKLGLLALAVWLSSSTPLVAAQSLREEERKKVEACEKITSALVEELVKSDPPIWTSDTQLKDTRGFKEYIIFKEIDPTLEYPLVRFDGQGKVTGTEMVMGAEVRLSIAQVRASSRQDRLGDKVEELLQQARVLVPRQRANDNVLGYGSFLKLANRAGEKKSNR